MKKRNRKDGKILIQVNEDNTGNIVIFPVCEEDQKMVAESNEYDHTYDIYIQNDYDRQSFIENFPHARYRTNKNTGELWGGYKIGRLWYFVNSGARFYIDAWEYRHMVGGQSD